MVQYESLRSDDADLITRFHFPSDMTIKEGSKHMAEYAVGVDKGTWISET